jgi:manganese/zinc/iron transport system permease protein
VLAFMTGPALAARLLTYRLKSMLGWAVGLGILCALGGVALTRHILTLYGVALSTSGVVVCVILFIYVCALLFAPKQGVVFRYHLMRMR